MQRSETAASLKALEAVHGTTQTTTQTATERLSQEWEWHRYLSRNVLSGAPADFTVAGGVL